LSETIPIISGQRERERERTTSKEMLVDILAGKEIGTPVPRKSKGT
jgi:hypothetical protein